MFVHFSNNYRPGVFYKFSSVGRDMYGYASVETNDDMPRHKAGFKQALTKFGVPVDRICGAYIQLDTVPHTADNVILIGDAGGFANKLTGEGLYDAFKTAANAKRAIVEGRSFSETNKEGFARWSIRRRCTSSFSVLLDGDCFAGHYVVPESSNGFSMPR